MTTKLIVTDNGHIMAVLPTEPLDDHHDNVDRHVVSYAALKAVLEHPYPTRNDHQALAITIKNQNGGT